MLLLLLAASQDVEQARNRFPPEITRAVLGGQVAAPAGFDEAVTREFGADRLAELRAGADPTGIENDRAALALQRIGADPDALRPPPEPGRVHERDPAQVTAREVESDYPVAPGGTTGWFRTGQDADIVLSAIDFDRSGGPLLFNHPMSIACDGTRLFLADTYNNRILVWTSLPDGNVAPDLVLGQRDLDSNLCGDGRDEMNWPVGVAVGGGRLAVADTENDRILIWNSMPESNAAPADIVIRARGRGIDSSTTHFVWPWGIWTDGERLAISSTHGRAVLIWNEFPTEDDDPADVVLRGGGIGTPRHITSDGRTLIVGDHNAEVYANGPGTFFWREFPTRDGEPHDFFAGARQGHGEPWLRGTYLEDGRLVLLGQTLYVHDSTPRDESDRAGLAIRGYEFRPGDHTAIAAAGERLYICAGNLNMVLCYRQVPERPEQEPDFAIGSPDIRTNTLWTSFILSNPVPISDGRSLVAVSDFDRQMYVWRERPDASGAHPDLVMDLGFGPLDGEWWNGRLLLGGTRTVALWEEMPLEGQGPSRVWDGRIGSVEFQMVRGVALDDRYCYVGDFDANRVYVWEGIPEAEDEPAYTLDVQKPWRLSTDGTYLAVSTFDRHEAVVYRTADLSAAPVRVRGRFNQVPHAIVADGHLFLVDGGNHRVFAWRDIEDAMRGRPADAILGQESDEGDDPAIGRDRLAWPASVWFDGDYLWVGETKFSERLLRFSPAGE